MRRILCTLIALAWVLMAYPAGECQTYAGGSRYENTDRRLYKDCLFDCLADSLDGNCVFQNCSFQNIGNAPLLHSRGTGVVFLGCNFTAGQDNIPTVYLTDGGAQAALVDCSFNGGIDSVAWASSSDNHLKYYQYNVTLNGSELIVGDTLQTVCMDGLPLLDAYRFSLYGCDYYNLYNLLSGFDGWDPTGQEPVVRAAEEYYSRRLTGIPVSMQLATDSFLLTAGQEPTVVTFQAKLMSGQSASPQMVGWMLSNEDDAAISEPGVTDNRCTVYSISQKEQNSTAMLQAVSESGLEASLPLTLRAELLAAPQFIERPHIEKEGGKYVVRYKLDLQGHCDESRIIWGEIVNSGDSRNIHHLVTTSAEYSNSYTPTPENVGKYLTVRVDARSNRSDYGQAATCITSKQVPVGMARRGRKH